MKWEAVYRYLPNAEAAFYFSGVTYATVGYGDIVLANQRPRKTLGFETPASKLQASVASTG